MEKGIKSGITSIHVNNKNILNIKNPPGKFWGIIIYLDIYTVGYPSSPTATKILPFQ